jgi:ADP-dependent NAD(P)H-hydrate dehydratase
MTTEINLDHLRGIALPTPDSDGDKNQRGRVLVIAGSLSVPGGALLAGTAALRAGAGKLQLATCERIAVQMGLALPEALVIPLPETPDGHIGPDSREILRDRVGKCDAVLIGPGMINADSSAKITAGLLHCAPGPAFVLDAAALAHLRDSRESLATHNARIVITPHAGEMARLLEVSREDVVADPRRFAQEAASFLKCVVVLKGPETFVISPDGQGWIYKEGSVGLATSGSGDTLAGVIVGLLARGAPPEHAAQWGVYLHGEAGNRLARLRGRIGFLARELLAEIPSIMSGAS